MRKRIKYSQNFIKDHQLIGKLLSETNIASGDLVLDIGSGQGIISDELLKRNVRVKAYEIDKNLYAKLVDRYGNNSNIELLNNDFLSSSLPSKEYKVFSNIPFNITSDIVKKLTFSDNPPQTAYLFVQKAAANKFLGKPMDQNNSLFSIFLKVTFELSLFHQFNRNDFFPKPSVEVVILEIQKLKKPHITSESKNTFYDFVTFAFSQFEPSILQGLKKIIPVHKMIELSKQHSFSPSSKPSELDFKHWLALFQTFENTSHKSKVYGSFNKLQKQQHGLQKIHRTRLDRNWKSF